MILLQIKSLEQRAENVVKCWFHTCHTVPTLAAMTLKSKVMWGEIRTGLWQSAQSDIEPLWLCSRNLTYLMWSLNSHRTGYKWNIHHCTFRCGVPFLLLAWNRWLKHNELAALCLGQSSLNSAKALSLNQLHITQSEQTIWMLHVMIFALRAA